MSDEARLYTSAEVSEIVRQRIAKMRGMPSHVLQSLIIGILERLDALEARFGDGDQRDDRG